MAISYSLLTPQDYFALSQFDDPRGSASIASFLERKGAGENLYVYRVEISRELAMRVAEFIREDALNTRGPVPDVKTLEEVKVSQTIYTVCFSLHFISGKRGGWFILEQGGREPVIKDEFIQYGPKRKSGKRKYRYRRNLSYSEQNQVDHLWRMTPTLDQMLDWIVKKYRHDVKNIDFDVPRSLETLF